MSEFEFRTVTRVVVGWGSASRLGRILEGIGRARILLVTDVGLLRAGLLEPVLAGLDGSSVSVFADVVADPPEAVVEACAAKAREIRADLVVGLGGGSSLDVAKLAAVMACGDQPLAEMFGIGNVRGGRLKLVQIPTTAGTGSEVTNISIVTTGETTKTGVVSPALYADIAVLDASLTLGLPAAHTAATGIDAMVHAIEATTSRHRKNPVSDALAREALSLLSAHLVTACRNGADRPAREAMMLGAMLAGQAFANAPVAAVHALAYPLGGRYHIPHGLSNALMLGPVLRFNAAAAGADYAKLGEVVPGGAGGASHFIAAMERLMDESGAPRRLRDVGVDEAMLPTLAADAMKQTRLLVNNPVEVTQADALALYEQAY